MNKSGGGSNTNKNGLKFEQDTSLEEALKNKGYVVNGVDVYKDDKYLGKTLKKNNLYKYLEGRNINYKDYNSKKYLPDELFLNENEKIAYVIEKKFQSSSGSVDEKLQTCEFKKMRYEKLFSPIGYEVDYIYVLNDWFEDKQYNDVKAFINEKGCKYFFNEIPLNVLRI